MSEAVIRGICDSDTAVLKPLAFQADTFTFRQSSCCWNSKKWVPPAVTKASPIGDWWSHCLNCEKGSAHAYTADEARENLLYTLCIYYTLDSTGRWTLRQSSQVVTSRRWSTSTAFTYKKRLPARHGCTFSWSSCTAAGGKTNTPSGST